MDHPAMLRVQPEPSKRARSLAPVAVIFSAFIGAVAAAELVSIRWGDLPGVVCQGVLVLVLLNGYVWGGPWRSGTGVVDEDPRAGTLPLLCLVPLSRILGATIPVRELPDTYWYAMVGVVLLVAVAMAARFTGRSPLGVRPRSWLPQLAIAASGIPLGLAAFVVLAPPASVIGLGWRDLAISATVLFIFAGLVEELVFRGLLQQAATEVFGGAAFLWTSALYGAVNIGSLSVRYVLFAVILGLFFGWCVRRTGSVWGVALAHGLLSAGAMVVYPAIGL